MPTNQLDLRNPMEVFVASCLTHYCKSVVPAFHRDMYQHLCADHERLVVEAPRDFAKSTVLSIFYPLYLICCTDEPELQMFSETGGPGGLSTKWARKMKDEIKTNTAMRGLYGVSPGDHWGQDYFQVKRVGRPSIDVYCKGKHSAARGGRGYVIIDDPQKMADVRSAVKLEADESWFYNDVINILEPGQRCIFIGSRMSPLSLLSKVARTPGWKLLSYRAIDDYGKSIWPEKWPLPELEKRRAEIGNDNFESEFQNRPKISDNPIIREEYIKHYEKNSEHFDRVRHAGIFTITGVDPAISKKTTADHTAIITVAKTFDRVPDYYVLDVKRFRGTLPETAKQVIQTWRQFQQNQTVVEAVGAFQHVILEIEKEEKINGLHVNLQSVVPTKDKASRAYGVQHLFSAGRVYFDLTDPAQQGLIEELLMFTGLDGSLFPDDRVDGLVHALTEGELHAVRLASEPEAGAQALPDGYGFQHTEIGGGRL